MANKTYKSSLFKRIIDLGKVPSADVDDLVRIWRVGTGDEKAITLQNFVETVDADLGGEGLTLTEIVTLIGEELGDFVTLDTDQTITGEKTFDNEFLSLVGYNPTLRIKATSNQSTLNFRNFTNEDQAGIILDTPSSKLSIVTRTDNSDIEIEPHGTGSIILPNVASGTPVSNLGLDVNNKVVKGAGGSGVTQTTSSWTPTLIDAGGGATYNISTNNRTFYVKTGRMVHVCIGMTGISTSGTPTGQLQITGLPFTASSNNFILSKIGAIYGSDLPASDAEKVVVLLAPSSTTLVFRADNNVSTNNLNAVTFTSGSLYISFSYITN